MSFILSAKNLCVGYDKKVVIENFNMSCSKGDMVCLIGANGAGKSTVLKTLSGLIPSLDGEIFIYSEDIKKTGSKNLAKKIAVVLTDKMNISFLTVFDIVSMGRYPYTGFIGNLGREDFAIIEWALESLQALELSHRYYASLSDGEKQKVMIARALAQNPEILILDEPTSHLDWKHKMEVLNILKNLCINNGLTVILSIHDIDLAFKCASKILFLNNGKIEGKGTPEAILKNASFNDLFKYSECPLNSFMSGVEFSKAVCGNFFITGGGGTGSVIYRALVREKVGLSCGILHKNDIDYHVAKGLQCNILSEESFNNISDENFNKALNCMKNSSYVIDTGFPVGEANKKNIDIIQKALDMGKIVLSLRKKEEYYPSCLEKNIIYFACLHELTEYIIEINKSV